jgi:hypothetical protein
MMGAQGEQGLPGNNGTDGQDGYTPIKYIDYFDGATGNAGADGEDGYTPVKGTDYFDGNNGTDGQDGYTPIKGVDYFDGAKGDKGDQGEPGTGEGDIVVVLTGDRTNSSTSFADITGLTFTPLAGKTYIIEAWLIFQSNTAGTGIGFAGNGPASPTAYVMNANIPIALTLYASDSMMASRAYNVGTPSVSVDAINSNLLAKIDCLLVNGVNSTAFTLRFKAETTGTVKVLAGSVLRYRQVN